MLGRRNRDDEGPNDEPPRKRLVKTYHGVRVYKTDPWYGVEEALRANVYPKDSAAVQRLVNFVRVQLNDDVPELLWNESKVRDLMLILWAAKPYILGPKKLDKQIFSNMLQEPLCFIDRMPSSKWREFIMFIDRNMDATLSLLEIPGAREMIRKIARRVHVDNTFDRGYRPSDALLRALGAYLPGIDEALCMIQNYLTE